MQLKRSYKSDLLLILPCNDGAAHGNYFVPLNPRKGGWNAWREADKLLAELREGDQEAVDEPAYDFCADHETLIVVQSVLGAEEQLQVF